MGRMQQSTILPVTSPNVHQFKKFFHQIDKRVEKLLITPKMLGYTTSWLIINYSTYQIGAIFDIHILQGIV